MRIRHILTITAIILFAAGISLADSGDSIALAIIADSTSGLDESPLVSLLEVELSQKDGPRLLEREKIDNILAEQKLSAAQLVDRETAIKIGKLLRVDAFVILSLENQAQDANNLVRVRVAETAHGLRLMDYFVQPDSENPKEAVQNIINKIQDVVQKINQPAGEMIPVGIVDIHRVQLGEQYKMLERTLPKMLSVRLSLEPKIIMLEREDLKLLLDEKLMTEGPDSEFWSSAVLIDGYIQPHNGSLEMKLEVKQAAGEEILSCTVPVEPNEAVVAIDKAATEIIEKLQDSPPKGKWNPAQEAEQFYKQGQMLHKNKRYEEAFPSLETAYALQPDNVCYTGAIFINEWYARFVRNYKFQYEESGFTHYSDFELAEIVCCLVDQIIEGYENQNINIMDILCTWGEPLGLDYKQVGYFGSYFSISTDEVRTINSISRQKWVKTMRLILKEFYDPIKPIELAWVSSENPEEVISNLKAVFGEHANWRGEGAKLRYEKFYPYWRTWLLPWYNNTHSELLFPQNSSDPGLEKTQLRNSAKRFKQLWMEYLLANTENNNPLAKYISCLALCDLFKQEQFTDEIKSEYYRHKALEVLTDEILISDSFTNQTKINASNDIKRNKPFLSITEFEELLDSFIEQKDVNSIVILDPGSPPNPIEINDDTYMRFLDQQKNYSTYLDKMISFLNVYKSKPEVNRILINMRNFKSNYDSQIAKTNVIPKANKPHINMLIRKEDWPEKNDSYGFIQQSIYTDNQLWLAIFTKSIDMTGPDSSRIGHFKIKIAGIDIKNKELVLLRQTVVTAPYSDIIRLNNGIVINSEKIYLPISGLGILELPCNFTKKVEIVQNPTILTAKNGLPSVSFTAIANSGDKMWIAYEEKGLESGLGLYDPETEQWETIFCSTLKGKKPFNSDKNYKIYALMPIHSGKLLFLVLDPGEYWKYDEIRNCDGLWQLDNDTQDVKYFGPIWNMDYFEQPYIEYLSNKLFLKTIHNLIEFDINDEIMKFVLGEHKSLIEMRKQKIVPISELEYDLFIPDVLENRGNFMRDYFEILSSTIHKDKMWARLGKSQIIILSENKPWTDAEIIDNDILDGEPVLRFVSTPYGLVGIGQGTVGIIEIE